MIWLPESVREALEAIVAVGGRPLLVGGCVRDMVMGHAAKDVDVEVFGLSVAQLRDTLSRFFEVSAVGESFGVLKVRLPGGEEVDFSVPRKESRIGARHQDFEVSFGDMTLKEAAARRDFTMNALMYDPFAGQVIDFYEGQRDIRLKVLRSTSPAFTEDPLRVLRAMQFAGRFDMVLTPETVRVCRTLLPEAATIPVERVWVEWQKWATLSVSPSAGLQALYRTWWVRLYPELDALDFCPQDATTHPEGNVWAHTKYVVDAAVRIAERDGLGVNDRLVLLFATLCHDLGKPATTVEEEGRIKTPRHAYVGSKLAESFLGRIGCPPAIQERVIPLVREHMAHIGAKPEPRAVRRLAVRLGPATVEEWARLVEADKSGRPPLPPASPGTAWVEMARELRSNTSKPEAILMGRHLLPTGMKPGPAMGALLKSAYEAQLDGAFDDVGGALEWVDARR